MTVNTLHIQLMLITLKGFHNFVLMALLHPSLCHLDCAVNVFCPFLEKAWAESTFSCFTAGICLTFFISSPLPSAPERFAWVSFSSVFFCSLHVSSSFFCFILSSAEGSWFVFCFLFVIRHFSQVCAFVLRRFCVALAVARNWTQPSCQSQNHGEHSAKHQHHTACKSPKMLPRTKEGKQKHRAFFSSSFIHQYAFELPWLQSQNTMDLGFFEVVSYN